MIWCRWKVINNIQSIHCAHMIETLVVLKYYLILKAYCKYYEALNARRRTGKNCLSTIDSLLFVLIFFLFLLLRENP